MRARTAISFLVALMAGQAMAGSVAPVPADQASSLIALPTRIVGRTSSSPEGDTRMIWRQWPGTHFETRMRGQDAYILIGPGDMIANLTVDDRPIARLIKPVPGLYALRDLGRGTHRIALDIVSESQAGPTAFGGFFAPEGGRPARLKAPRRQIEFIGDSHSVGYGNLSATTTCTSDQVWETTDSSQSFATLLARHYHADRQINAISGRGIVRNYDGMAMPTLPEAYPFALLDPARPIQDPGWAPQLIVIALGTNDFSTALHAGERWPDRNALHADFEDHYVRFVQSLRAKYPDAMIILWATVLADGEILRSVNNVAERLHLLGETRLTFVPITKLDFSACHGHPSLADERQIFQSLRTIIDKQSKLWKRRKTTPLAG